ncbi:MAG: single-stranded-DNA-specific exonuclease RecJ, partial [Alistipes sp.]|nr:single-stranded-DNA-specific exonuclease RecJ [Alistipes sp.]
MPIEKRWVVKPQGDKAAVEALASQLGMSKVLTNLLVQRGIDTVEKAKRFFSPALRDLHDPFLMKDMDKAVERIERAVKAGEKVMIYG